MVQVSSHPQGQACGMCCCASFLRVRRQQSLEGISGGGMDIDYVRVRGEADTSPKFSRAYLPNPLTVRPYTTNDPSPLHRRRHAGSGYVWCVSCQIEKGLGQPHLKLQSIFISSLVSRSCS